MTKNPVINALAASGYIAVVAFGIFNAESYLGPVDTVIAPILFLSLFVFSAAVMGYLFLYQPLLLILGGEQEKGIALFLQTMAAFAVVTIVLMVVWSLLAR